MALQIVTVNDASPGVTAVCGLTYNGSTTITSAKIIAGTSLTMSGTIAVTGNFAVNTDKFSVAATTGNTIIAGTATITGAVAAAASITLGAGADLVGSSTSDITINTNKFTVAGATGNTIIAGTLTQTGVATFNNAMDIGAVSNSALSGANAVNLDKAYHGYTTNSTADLDLSVADGTTGQHLWLKLETKDTNNVVITPANLADGSTITLDATGELCHLVFSGTTWQLLASTGTLA